MLPYQRSRSPYRATFCSGVDESYAAITYVKRKAYLIDETLALCYCAIIARMQSM